jgi:DNA-binding NarL/FixJ family response regulator
MEPLRVMLVDDHILFRKGVAALLATQPGIEVVAEAGDGLEAIARARETLPEVILMDISMPNCNGLDAVQTIKREMPHVRIIMLTVSDDDSDLFGAIKSGADGYLLKNLQPEQLFSMLEGLRKGEVALSGVLAARILQEFRQPERQGRKNGLREELTPREAEVLAEVVKGATNKEIAATLNITENTVKIHLCNILGKLHLQNRIQAAVYAVRKGLVGDEPQ